MDSALIWDGNWAWSLPLVVFTVIFHAAGLGLISRGVSFALARGGNRVSRHVLFPLVMGTSALLATLLHASEAGVWALTYFGLGAVADGKSALLYSLNAITAYGHTDLRLAAHWQLMGAVEALNGFLLFGLTTAFLYGVIRRVWPLPGQTSGSQA